MDAKLYEKTLYGEVRSVPGKGYRAYYPNPLPQSIDMAHDTVMRLADAEAALGRLAGAGRLLPNPHLLIRPYLLKEALSSARIEGTQASLLGVLEAEAEEQKNDPDIEEVLNYVMAMEEGLAHLNRLPFSLRLVRSMHAVLLRGVRGRERQPGRSKGLSKLDRTSRIHTGDRLLHSSTPRRTPFPVVGLGVLRSREPGYVGAGSERLAALPVRDNPPLP